MKKQRMEKKRQLKLKFDANYDDDDGVKTHYDELKKEVDEQAMVLAASIVLIFAIH